MRRPGRLLVLGLGLASVAAVSVIPVPRAAPALTPFDDGVTPSAVTVHETISRAHLVNGQNTVVDTRTVSLTVGQTTDLQGRQEVSVSWSGAHPTGGIVPNQNSPNAAAEEYPFVLLECRGVASTTAPAAQQISPSTCWTQTWTEHYQDSLDDPYPPYRLDRDSTDTAAVVGAPSPLPSSCQLDETAPVQYWVPFVAASGQVYAGGNAGCAGEPPESDDVGNSPLPSNETFGVTGTDGTGHTTFDIFTATQNQSLGCSPTVPCALVAVPIMGISCNPGAGVPTADVTACEGTGQFAPGQLMPTNGGGELTVSGALWWSPSNWQNRMVVPLSFATPSDVCSVTGQSAGGTVDVYGSESMIQATSQWAPYFCLQATKKFDFVHVQTGEPEARTLVASGGAEAAFTSDAPPGGYGKPVVNAPVAVTGFAVSFAIDGANGQPVTTLKLTARLLAKLLTESYPGDLFLKQADPALANNPLNITLDPEFQQLNPQVGANPSASDEAASELIAMSGGSDVMSALTTYINDDPAARAWLNGAPDQWGMVVNPAYQGIVLPVDQWPLLSTFEPTAWYQADENDCLYHNPVPYQPLVAAPLASLEDISESMQYAQPNSTTVCSQPNPGTATGEKLVTNGRQPPGHRFMLGITPLADNDRYQIAAASLQTTPGTFVAPSTASLEAAAQLLAFDASSGTWPIPYAQFQQSAGAAAYPGTLVVYAAVPTEGLPAGDAADYAALLQYAATGGQQPGYGVGQLPPGYLPLTSGDGLASLAAYTEQAATDVAAQQGQLPGVSVSPPSTAPPPASPAPVSPATPLPDTGYVPSFGGYPSFGGPAASAARSVAPAAGAARAPSPPPKPTSVPLAYVVGVDLWTGGSLVVLVFTLALVGVLCVPTALLLGRRRGRW